MQFAQSCQVRDLRRGDCALLVLGWIDRWSDIEALTVAAPAEVHLVVVPRGGARHQVQTLTMHPDDTVLVVRAPGAD